MESGERGMERVFFSSLLFVPVPKLSFSSSSSDRALECVATEAAALAS